MERIIMSTITNLIKLAYPGKENDGAFLHYFHKYFNISGIIINEFEKQEDEAKAIKFLNAKIEIDKL